MENKDKRDIIDELYLTSMRIENIFDIADILAARLDNFNESRMVANSIIFKDVILLQQAVDNRAGGEYCGGIVICFNLNFVILLWTYP
ncbi:MAG: hypothetical protein FWE03_05875 [Firmicutes bacterium]|nr:hypothetical protein [Bacillota bacterium]